MNKMLSLVGLTLVFASALCYFPSRNEGMFNNIESQTVSVPDSGLELLKKFNDLHCLAERYGEPCWHDYTISIYKNTTDCEMYVYEGCFNNQTRFYNAEMCNGECKLPLNNDNAPANGGSAPDSVAASSLNQPTVPGINSTEAIPPPILNSASQA